MSKVMVTESYLDDIADAIRSKKGTQDTYTPAEMAEAIESISGGGITPTGTINITSNGTVDVTNYASASVAVPNPSTGTKQISITSNGTTTEDVTQYANAQITANVPNSYSAVDEGKVVSNGALVAQTSDTVTANDTYDTTLINSLTVAVSGGGSGLSLIDTITATGVRGTKIDVDINWFNTYNCIFIVPDLTFSAADWLYLGVDATSGNNYSSKINGADSSMFVFVSPKSSSAASGVWVKDSGAATRSSFLQTISTYLYFYLYNVSTTMTGKFYIYGVTL